MNKGKENVKSSNFTFYIGVGITVLTSLASYILIDLRADIEHVEHGLQRGQDQVEKRVFRLEGILLDKEGNKEE